MARLASSGMGVHCRRVAVLSLSFVSALHDRGACSAAASTMPARRAFPQKVIKDLSKLHVSFGGDSSVWDNRPMPQRAPSGGTISAMSVQMPALEHLAPFLEAPGSRAFDLGFGSGVMVAMLLAVAGKDSKVVGVDLKDKIPVARSNLLRDDTAYGPFAEEKFELLGGDAFEYLTKWKEEGRQFDVVYAGCSMDPATDQLSRFLGVLKPTGAAVFNLGRPGEQAMYLVAQGGKVCELLLQVNFMMAVSPSAEPLQKEVPMDPSTLGKWIQQNVFQE